MSACEANLSRELELTVGRLQPMLNSVGINCLTKPWLCASRAAICSVANLSYCQWLSSNGGYRIYLLSLCCFWSAIQDELEPLIQFTLNLLAVSEIFYWVVLELTLLISSVYPASQSQAFRSRLLNKDDLHSKFSPFGPAQFCAKPAVIQVGERIQVYS